MRKISLVLAIILFLTFSLFLYLQYSKQNEFKVIFFNIGQGDSALIKFENGQKMLVDCGPDRTVLYKLGEYLPFWDRQIDYLVISHFDRDHYGGCVDVLKRYEVKNVITNGVAGSDEYYNYFNDLLDLRLKTEDLRLTIIDGYKQFEIGSSTLEFLWPLTEKPMEGDNDNSAVFKLSHAGTTVLFVGDLEIKGEVALLGKYCVSSFVIPAKAGIQDNGHWIRPRAGGDQARDDNPPDCVVFKAGWLKIAHHGSGGSSSEEFLQAVSPKQVIISVGENKFGHPSRRVLKKLERLGVEILRTDVVGDIMIDE